MTENGSLVKLLFKYFIPNLFSSFTNDLISGIYKTCMCTYTHTSHTYIYTHIYELSTIFLCMFRQRKSKSYQLSHISKRKENQILTINCTLKLQIKDFYLGCNAFSLVREHCYFDSDNQLNLSSKYMSSLSCTFLVVKRAVSSHPLDRLWCTNPLAPRSIQFGISVFASWKNENK